jgi:hypothetical protein
MGSFKRVLLGYRRSEVEAAISTRESRIRSLETAAEDAVEGWHRAAAATVCREAEVASLSAMVLEREREVRNLGERLRDANERHDRNIASIEAISGRLAEIRTQARGQATRIRMKALREAVEVSRRTQELRDAEQNAASNGQVSENGALPNARGGLFEGLVRVEIGPLGDFSQLVGFEDAAGQIDATSEISVERFSEGRATLSMRLSEPVELLRELEERSRLEFRVRHTAADNLILDLDEDP